MVEITSRTFDVHIQKCDRPIMFLVYAFPSHNRLNYVLNYCVCFVDLCVRKARWPTCIQVREKFFLRFILFPESDYFMGNTIVLYIFALFKYCNRSHNRIEFVVSITLCTHTTIRIEL